MAPPLNVDQALLQQNLQAELAQRMAAHQQAHQALSGTM